MASFRSGNVIVGPVKSVILLIRGVSSMKTKCYVPPLKIAFDAEPINIRPRITEVC